MIDPVVDVVQVMLLELAKRCRADRAIQRLQFQMYAVKTQIQILHSIVKIRLPS